MRCSRVACSSGEVTGQVTRVLVAAMAPSLVESCLFWEWLRMHWGEDKEKVRSRWRLNKKLNRRYTILQPGYGYCCHSHHEDSPQTAQSSPGITLSGQIRCAPLWLYKRCNETTLTHKQRKNSKDDESLANKSWRATTTNLLLLFSLFRFCSALCKSSKSL